MTKLIVLDRDGVINKDSASYIKSPKEWQAVPGSLAAIAKLTSLGYKIVIATNQSGIARGYFTIDTLNAIHKKMLAKINAAGGHIEHIFICPHGPNDNCGCRKPKPGLLLQAASQLHISPSEMLVIGDSIRDITAAQSFGANAIFIQTANKSADLLAAQAAGVQICTDLAEAADIICKKMCSPVDNFKRSS